MLTQLPQPCMSKTCKYHFQKRYAEPRRAGWIVRSSPGDNGLWGGIRRALGGGQDTEPNTTTTTTSSSSSSQPSSSSSSSSAAPRAILQGTPDNPLFPPYRVIRKGPKYDLRLYEVYPVVEMEYSRRETGYLQLGGYLDGANTSKTRFGFSAPVVMCYTPQGPKVMQMYVGGPKLVRPAPDGTLPPPPSVKELPPPTDPDVRLNVAGGELVAVAYFEGFITPDTAEAVRQQLIAALQADGLSLAAAESVGSFRVGQYGQVHTLDKRVNELLLEVAS